MAKGQQRLNVPQQYLHSMHHACLLPSVTLHLKIGSVQNWEVSDHTSINYLFCTVASRDWLADGDGEGLM